MENKSSELQVPDKEKVVDLNFYRIKKNLKSEGFEIVTNKEGKLTLVLRIK